MEGNSVVSWQTYTVRSAVTGRSPFSNEHIVEAVCNNKGEKKSASDNNIQKKKKEI